MKSKFFYKKLTALVVSGLMAAMTSTAMAANTVELGLEDSIQMALENNRTIKESLADVDTAKWAISQSRRKFGPALSWSATGMRTGGESFKLAKLQSGGNPDYEWNYGNI